MRSIIALLSSVLLAGFGSAQDAPTKVVREVVPIRFNIIPDLEVYPQAEPKDLLASLIKAIEKDRFDYVLAHLSETAFVDQKIGDSKATFEELVGASKVKFREDPSLLKAIKLLAREGEVNDQGAAATVAHKDLKDRKIFLVKVGQRWFLKNERVDAKAKP